MNPTRSSLRLTRAARIAAPILAGYLFFGTCGAGKKGFVLGAKVWGVTFTAAWCSAG